MGLANGLNFILDAAAELKRRNIEDVSFFFMVTAWSARLLKTRAKSEKSLYVIFSDPIPKKKEKLLNWWPL